MGWRQDEVWLDAELLWFRETSPAPSASLAVNAPRFLGLSPAALAASIPSGLAASRRRRAELARRRAARKTRAAALVIGPAMLLALAGPRPGSASRPADVLPEDPPSLTLRPERPTAGTPDKPAAPAQEAVEAPEVHWHSATSHGLPYAGWLSSGTQLPLEGPSWLTWNPVEDTVPNRPRRLYGHERTIRRIMSVAAEFRQAFPNAPRIVVGDISFRDGGPMELHRSHQNGLDVDVYYPRNDGKERAPTHSSQVDRRLSQELLDRFVAAGARMVFVGYSLHLHGPSGVVIPYPNHEDHMHVRFRAPAD